MEQRPAGLFEPVDLGPEDAPEIAAFTRVGAEFDLLTTTSVRRAIFADPDPQVVWGHYDAGLDGVCVAVVREQRGFVKLLAVHPRIRRRRVGSSLLARAEEWLRSQGARTVEVGASAPFYVVPGTDVRTTEALCLLEAAGYERTGEAVNLSVPLREVPEPTLSVRHATEADLTAFRGWVSEHHPRWIRELERSFAIGTCLVHRDLGFACYDVNREGWFGPIATHPAHRGRGIGASVLCGALHAMRGAGHERAEVAWAEAIPFYVRVVGARISRVFWRYSKEL